MDRGLGPVPTSRLLSLALSAILSAICPILHAQAVPAPAATATLDKTVPASTSPKYWTLGLCRLSGPETAPEFRLLASVLPALMLSELPVLPPRLASIGDMEAAAGLASERSKFDAGSEFARQLDDRAAKFLDPSIRPERRGSELIAADVRLSTAEKRFSDAMEKASKARNHESQDALPSALSPANASGELFDPPAVSPAATSRAKAVDFLVFGKVEAESGYAAVELSGYDASVDRVVFTWRGFCSPEDPAPLAQDFARKLERWIAGRDFARIEIAVTPQAASVFVDGRELGEQERVLFRFAAGRIVVEAEAEGFEQGQVEETVSLGDRRRIIIPLAQASTGIAHITSEPDGASLSIDAARSGTTPQDIPLSGRRSFITARKDGFEDMTVVLPEKGVSTIAITLRPEDHVGPSGRVNKAKDEFYTALGWMVLSIPVTVLSTGAYNTYLEAAPRSNLDSGLVTGYNVSSVVLGAAAVATAVFTVNAIIRLVRYLRAAK